MASAYQAPAYSDKYRKGISTSFYTNAVKNYTKQANADRQTQLNEAAKTQKANLRQAYINRLQSQKALDTSLATAGIRGGATETSNLKLANQYGTAVASANTDYANSVNTINRAVDQNIRDYRSDMMSRAEEYRQNLAQAKWQAAREDKTNEVARQTEYWSNYYTNFYSGYSKKDAKKAVKTLQTKLKKAKTPAEKIRLQMAMSGAKARLGVIATSK